MLATFDRLLSRLLPRWLYGHLIGDWSKDGIKKYVADTSWIFFAKMVTFVISFFTITFVARYLGPENYGKLSYAQSFVSIFSIFASLGIDLIIYRDLVAHPEKEREIIGTAVLAKFVFGFLTLCATLITALTLHTEPLLTVLIGIVALTFIFQPFSTVGHVFNARVQSRYPSYIAIGVALLLPVLKLVIIFLDKGIIYFAAIVALEAFIFAVANIVLYTYVTKQSPRAWRFSLTTFTTLFHESWPLMLAGFSGYIYGKIDQVMIQHYINSTAVGLYDVAVRLTEPLSFLPGVIIGSLFPAVVKAKTTSVVDYRKRLRALTVLCLSISFVLVVIMFVLAPHIIKLMFGPEFTESVTILRVYVWSNFGTVAAALIYNYFITENKTRAFLVFTVMGATINVLLNLALIPRLGMIGAAYATVATLTCICIVFLLTRNNLLARTNPAPQKAEQDADQFVK